VAYGYFLHPILAHGTVVRLERLRGTSLVPFSLRMLSVAKGTKVSLPTCMVCREEQKTTTRSPLISVLSALAYDVYTEAIIDIVHPTP
jgi:hypothetical protein